MTVAQMKIMVSSITLKMNGKPVREWTPASLDISNATNGTQFAAANGYLRDFFAMPWLRTMEGEERNALGTVGLRTLTYEIVFSGTAVTPTVKAWANVDEYDRPVTAYPFRHIRNYNALPVVNGTTQWPGGGLLKDVGLWYGRLHFQSAAITKVKVQANGVTKWDDLPRALVGELMAKAGLAQQANTYSLAFDLTSKQFTDILSTFTRSGNGYAPIADLRLEYTGNAAGTVDVCTEQFQLVNTK
jgi:hypothetical protein